MLIYTTEPILTCFILRGSKTFLYLLCTSNAEIAHKQKKHDCSIYMYVFRLLVPSLYLCHYKYLIINSATQFRNNPWSS